MDGAVQCVEYKALSMVCFSSGKYGHVKEMCPSSEKREPSSIKPTKVVMNSTSRIIGDGIGENKLGLGSWALDDCGDETRM